MASKDELQTVLKSKYGINKNISQPLNLEECTELLYVLNREPGAAKLVESFAQKNSTLGDNNRHYGRLREQSERKLESVKAEYRALEAGLFHSK